MIRKRDIVDRAFKLLSMSGFELDDAPEDEYDILQMLDDLMAELQTADCSFGYVFFDDDDSDLNDPSGIARDAVSGIAHKLALRICSLYGKAPPALLIGQAASAYNALLTRYMTRPDQAQVSDTWHFGSGNIRGYW